MLLIYISKVQTYQTISKVDVNKIWIVFIKCDVYSSLRVTSL